MNYRKMLSSLLIGTLCLSALCSCSMGNEGSGSKKKKDKDKTQATETTTEETTTARIDCELPEDEIIMISSGHNESESYYDSITYVMSDGNVYCSAEFWGTNSNNWDNALSDEDRLALLKKYTQPICTIDKGVLTAIYQDIMQIDPDADFVYEDEECYDAGTGTTEVNQNGNWIKISESGVYTGVLDDPFAVSAKEQYKNAVSFTIDNAANVYSNTETYLETFECPDTTITSCKQMITSMDELKKFEEDTGIDLESSEYFDGFGDHDYDRFNWCYIAVEVIGWDEYLSLEDVSADAFIVSDDYVGFGLTEDPQIDISDEIVEQKYYCYVAQVPGYDISLYDGFETN